MIISLGVAATHTVNQWFLANGKFMYQLTMMMVCVCDAVACIHDKSPCIICIYNLHILFACIICMNHILSLQVPFDLVLSCFIYCWSTKVGEVTSHRNI